MSKLITLENLQKYDELIKNYVDTADAKSIKTIKYDPETRQISFYKTDSETEPAAYTVTLPEDVDITGKADKVASAVAGDVATLDVNGNLVDGGVKLADISAAIADTGILKSAKDYTDALANGAVATNTSAIADINNATSGIYAQAKLYADTEVGKVNDKIGTVADDTTVVAMIADAKKAGTDAQTAADNAQDDVDALETLVGTIPADATSTTVVAYAKEVADAAAGDASKVAEDLAEEITRAKAAEKANADAITVLNGAETVDGSVAKTVADGINDFATKISDDGTINTFKELIDYAAAHQGEYSTLSGDVQKNTTAITTINGEGEGSIKKALADAKEYADDLDEAMDGRVDALETTVGDATSGLVKDVADLKTAASTGVDDKIKAAIEDLDYTTAATGDYVASITQADGVIAPVYANFVFTTEADILALFVK